MTAEAPWLNGDWPGVGTPMYGHPNYASWAGFSMSSRQVHVPKHIPHCCLKSVLDSEQYGFAKKIEEAKAWISRI